MDNILLWIVISIFVLIVWSVMMGDPGSSDLSNHTVICGLIALPIITILV
jgi:preprotein translocase subunit SecG